MAITVHEVEQLQWLLEHSPIMAEALDPVTCAFLPSMPRLFEDPVEMICELDMPSACTPEPYIVLQSDPGLAHRFPTVSCTHGPYTSELNDVLLSHFSFISQHMLSQAEVADRILADTLLEDVEAVVLLLVDGLSYQDVVDWHEFASITPCLVPGLTTTLEGFYNVIGCTEPLVERLFDRGYTNRFGFTYWTRKSNPLTNRLFAGIAPERITTIFSMQQVLEVLSEVDLHHAYVQIVRTGLDPDAHGTRLEDLHERRQAVCEGLRQDLNALRTLLQIQNISILFYVVSDHGILWRDEHDLTPLSQVFEMTSARYWPIAKGTDVGEDTFNLAALKDKGRRVADSRRQQHYQLAYPYLRRPLKANEWGVHGGISFEESVVPLIRDVLVP